MYLNLASMVGNIAQSEVRYRKNIDVHSLIQLCSKPITASFRC
ncbi:hypothetical protein GAGA_4711 [Paraglaciecola agarilytica NO2]|uniref:Uncharacterized protein n=1 Tax=Paraglaciecola agarilytica NO2 TaxID=1125747 RepID=A0ABQ0IDS7_9ALTE|nr:hypothetical protein GAGA_4711 [Paraglaciecola agarilytica NO2]